jgi:hypothetical protein
MESIWGELGLLKTVSREKKAIFPFRSVLVYFMEVNCLLYAKDSKAVDAICYDSLISTKGITLRA